MLNAHTAEKYDNLADGFSERTWANLEFDMRRRFTLATTWGRALHGGDSVAEFGCGDGYLARVFIVQGYRYQGMDISSRMVAMAERRLASADLSARFLTVDVNGILLTEPVDAVVSYMGAFFTFVQDPLQLLQRIQPYIRKKIIVDLNPRGKVSLPTALDMLRAAGFRKVEWRPFFVPVTMKLPKPALRILGLCESVPVLRGLPLRWKFNVLIKGEAAPNNFDLGSTSPH